MLSKNEIFQSCSSASLSSQVFTNNNETFSLENHVVPSSTPGQDTHLEEEYSIVTFNSVLYALCKQKEHLNMQALESTEYT